MSWLAKLAKGAMTGLARLTALPMVLLFVPLSWLSAQLIPLWYREILRYTPTSSSFFLWLQDLALRVPEGCGGGRMRADLYRSCLCKLGRNPVILPQVRIVSPENVEVGDNIAINFSTMIVAIDKITIGNNVLIGPNTLVHSGSHRFSDPGVEIRKQGHCQGPICIEDDVWIGAHAIILYGCRIGKGAVVGAGAVVTKDVEPFTVVAGVPARKIGERRGV